MLRKALGQGEGGSIGGSMGGMSGGKVLRGGSIEGRVLEGECTLTIGPQ